MDKQKKYKWYKVAESEAGIPFSTGGLASVEVNGKKICISLNNDRLYACTAKCPHAGGSLADGYVDALGNIVCPLHRYRFNLQSGLNTSGEGYHLKRYGLEKREDGIFIGFEAGGLADWLK